jgi:DNA polymerase III delta prime subunit
MNMFIQKFINSELKYKPKQIGDLIFPNINVKNVVTAYASGQVTRPLILCGRNGTGKSLIAGLLPKAIEGIDRVMTTYIKPYELNTDKEVDKLFTRSKQFDNLFTTNGQRFSYYVIEEMNCCIGGRNSFRTALDNYTGVDLTIITTNEVARIDKGIRSRCEELEVPACTPEVFFPFAKKIMEKEGVEISDEALLEALEAVYEEKPDNRRYYQEIDRLFREWHLSNGGTQYEKTE